MHAKKEELPNTFEMPGAIFRMQPGQGNMMISYAKMPVGPLDAILEGLPNNSCQCPHWGYLFKGQITIQYHNGEKEVIKAGDVYYLPPGHSGSIDEEAVAIEFSPEKEYNEVIEHIKKKLQALT
jgi:hypothetical protein